MKIPPRIMSRIIKEDLGLGAYWTSTGQRLTETLRQIRVTRAKKLLQQYAKNSHRQIFFTDEKVFTVEEKFNHQNDIVYAHSSQEAAEKNSMSRKMTSSSFSDGFEWLVGSVIWWRYSTAFLRAGNQNSCHQLPKWYFRKGSEAFKWYLICRKTGFSRKIQHMHIKKKQHNTGWRSIYLNLSLLKISHQKVQTLILWTIDCKVF